jgi:hypothetical protein
MSSQQHTLIHQKRNLQLPNIQDQNENFYIIVFYVQYLQIMAYLTVTGNNLRPI